VLLSCILWPIIMARRTATVGGAEALLEQLRARRQLPTAAERRRIREAAGVSIRQLAAAVGVSPMAPVRWELGAQPRNPEHARVYARLLDEFRLLAPPKMREAGLPGPKPLADENVDGKGTDAA
jgi:hypothetical protein